MFARSALLIFRPAKKKHFLPLRNEPRDATFLIFRVEEDELQIF